MPLPGDAGPVGPEDCRVPALRELLGWWGGTGQDYHRTHEPVRPESREVRL